MNRDQARCATFALAIGALVASAGSARAVSITLETPAIVQLGASFSIQVGVSGLGAGVAPTLRSFDLALSWDDDRLGFESAALDPTLDPPGSSALRSTGSSEAGAAEAVWNSFAPAEELTLFQGDAFGLAGFGLRAQQLGDASVCVAQAELGGLGGVAIGAELPECQTIRVVPEVGTALLLAAGLFGLLGHPFRREPQVEPSALRSSRNSRAKSDRR